MSMKNPLTPAGIEPATFQFVAQHLNHCATAVPPPPHRVCPKENLHELYPVGPPFPAYTVATRVK